MDTQDTIRSAITNMAKQTTNMDMCGICHDEQNNQLNTNTAYTPCCSKFIHTSCLVQSVVQTKHHTCPYCRGQLFMCSVSNTQPIRTNVRTEIIESLYSDNITLVESELHEESDSEVEEIPVVRREHRQSTYYNRQTNYFQCNYGTCVCPATHFKRRFPYDFYCQSHVPSWGSWRIDDFMAPVRISQNEYRPIDSFVFSPHPSVLPPRL